MLESLSKVGPGGAGYQGKDFGSAFAALRELQGFRVSLLAGGSQDAKINLAAIRAEDTILSVLNNNAGTITDVTANHEIWDIRASGTLTLSSTVATENCTVNGKTYTFKDTPTAAYGDVAVGGSDTLSAANLAAAINAYENSGERANAGGPKVVASANAAVVTVTAIAEGAAGNAITFTGDATITASGSGTLAGGSDTGGITSTSGATNQLIVFWFDKR